MLLTSSVYCTGTEGKEYDIGLSTDPDDVCIWLFSAGCPNDPLYHRFSKEMAGMYTEGGDVIESFTFENSGEDVNGNFRSYLEASFTFNEATPKGQLHYKLDLDHGERGVMVDSPIDICMNLIITC